MYKRILLFTILILTSHLFYAQSTTVPYNASFDENIVNPDRGFYYPLAPGEMNNFSPISVTDLVNRRENLFAAFGANYQIRTGLFFRYYILDNSTDNLGSFPTQLQQDFNAARQAGARLIIRFAYTINPDTSCGDAACPPYGDAPKSRVLSHIAQLAPVLQANEDVISAIQNGFIGVWGEQYYTDYFGFATLSTTNWEDRIDVVSALLDATPANRMVQVRYPQMKQKYAFGPNAPVSSPAMSESQAYNGSDISRLGFHNDCFLSSPNDVGTYIDYSTGADQTAILKPYSGEDGRYVAVGGETCADNYGPNDCNGSAVSDMNALHYSYLNTSYNNDVNNDWQTGGCMAEIKRRLGYRFVMQNGTYPNSASAGSTISFALNLENQGFAAPYNERALYLVLRNGNNVYKAQISGANNDTRRWYSGNIALNATATLPADMPNGNYELLLHILDFSNNGAVAERPEYSIQLANTGTWEPNTGFNKLNHTISIGGTPPPPPSGGCITIDQSLNDWSAINTLSSNDGYILKAADESDALYISVTGSIGDFGDGYQIFLDTDNSGSEFSYFATWSQTGFDALIENGSFSTYTGTGNDWMWSAATTISSSKTAAGLELKIDKSLLNASSSNIRIGFVSLSNWIGVAFVPSGTNASTYVLSSFLNCGGCDDADNDGVCDDQDACPGTNDALIGTPCDDGDPCTQGETYNSSCQCANGTYTDADGDGVCAANDPDDSDPCNPNPCNTCVAIDGDFGDWLPIDILASNGLFMKAADDANAFYMYIGGSLGSNYQIFLDTDNNNSGAGEYTFTYWTQTGFNYLIENGALYAYTGTGADWTWTFQGQITAEKTNTELELRIDKSVFNANIANFGFLARDSNWGEIARIPTNNAAAHPLNASLSCGDTCPDSDNDNVCDDEDTCPGINDAIIGTPCDDGDPCTQGETYNTFCQCANGTYTDADNDGICAANDPDDSDPCNPNTCDNTCILIDQSLNDWSAINTLSSNAGFTLKAADDDSALYISVAGNIGPNYQVFLDTDNNNTGTNEFSYFGTWSQTGINVMLENGLLSNYIGTGNDWAWSTEIPISNSRTAAGLELKVDKSLLSSNISTIRIGFASLDANFIGVDFVPVGDNAALYTLSSALNCGTNPCPDADGDSVCDADDICPNADDNADLDGDNIPNACDNCPTDPTNSCNSTPTYCGASGNDATYEYIERVTFGSISNASGNNGGYADFTSQVVNVGLGDIIPFNLTPGFSNTAYDEAWTIWIDFNRDGDFNDAGEAVYSGNSTGTLSGNVNIPTNASSGLTGMRVAMQWQNTPPSCGSFTYGEVEDYTVNITNMAQNYSPVGLYVEHQTPAPSMRIAPNPASDIINIAFQNIRNEGIIEIYDLTGKSLTKQTLASDTNNLTLQVNHLTEGVYIIRLKLDNGTYANERFIKLQSN